MNWYDGLTIGKDPVSVIDYQFDWSTWLGADTISAYQMTAAIGLTIDSDSNTTTAVDVWLSGGDTDTAYSLTCQITTAAGRTASRAITVDCGLAPGQIGVRVCP